MGYTYHTQWNKLTRLIFVYAYSDTISYHKCHWRNCCSWRLCYCFDQSPITLFMFISAFGYCFAMYYLIFQDGLDLDFFRGKLNINFMKGLLIIFLITAACWIHTTFAYLEHGNQILWTFVQLELWLTGITVFLMMIGVCIIFVYVLFSL